MRKLKRNDFQELALTRIREAGLLLDAGSHSGSYYLTGLALECALKACIARLTEAFEFPDLKRVQDSWHHDLTRLMNTAGLADQLTKRTGTDREFEANWRTAKDWNVEARYDQKGEREARDIYTAATEPQHGILAWLQEHW